jgi:hypothetical protein
MHGSNNSMIETKYVAQIIIRQTKYMHGSNNNKTDQIHGSNNSMIETKYMTQIIIRQTKYMHGSINNMIEIQYMTR